MSPKNLPPDRRPPTSAADAAERLARIVDAAERAAEGVIDDAEEQARQRVEEAQARADRIVAERLRALADELDPPAGGETPPSHLRSVGTDRSEDETPHEADGFDGVAPGGRRSGSAGARLLATQMAVSGSSRPEIEARLRARFDLHDTREILDAILGPEE